MLHAQSIKGIRLQRQEREVAAKPVQEPKVYIIDLHEPIKVAKVLGEAFLMIIGYIDIKNYKL